MQYLNAYRYRSTYITAVNALPYKLCYLPFLPARGISQLPRCIEPSSDKICFWIKQANLVPTYLFPVQQHFVHATKHVF